MSYQLVSTTFPFLPLHIHVRVSKAIMLEQDTQALVDTGFSGDIVLPTSEAVKGYEPDAYATWAMADGSEVMAPIFLGNIRFPELEDDVAVLFGVTVTFLGDQPLIGQNVLRQFTLTLDHGKRVILEP
jgi:predicted aspartyl protease